MLLDYCHFRFACHDAKNVLKPENKASPSSLSLMAFHKVQIYAIAMTFQIKNLYDRNLSSYETGLKLRRRNIVKMASQNSKP